MSQRNYLYELEKFLKEYGHNEELSILTACQKASMSSEILKKFSSNDGEDYSGWGEATDSKKSDDGEDYSRWGDEVEGEDFSDKKIDIPSGFCDSWAYTGSSLALTIIGLFPGIGIPFDIGNGLLNIYCGDYVYAFLSFVAAIPAVGYIGNALKALFAGLKGTLKGGPALIKLIVNWWKNSKKVKKLKKLEEEYSKLKKKAKRLKEQYEKSKLAPINSTLPVSVPTEIVEQSAYVANRGRAVLDEIAEVNAALTKTGNAFTKAKDTIKTDWSNFTKAFAGLLKDSGQYSKMLGIPNSQVRSFMRWTKDILYQVEERVIGVDKNISQYRIGD